MRFDEREADASRKGLDGWCQRTVSIEYSQSGTCRSLVLFACCLGSPAVPRSALNCRKDQQLADRLVVPADGQIACEHIPAAPIERPTCSASRSREAGFAAVQPHAVRHERFNLV
jgi:hypothetical protein